MMLIFIRGIGKLMFIIVVKKIVFVVDFYYNGREVIFVVDFYERVGKLLMLLIFRRLVGMLFMLLIFISVMREGNNVLKW